MKIKAVIFDLDGTLVNSLKDIADNLNKALEEFGFLTHSEESYKEFIGEGVANLIKNALPQNKKGDDSLIESIRQRYSKYYEEHYLDFTKEYDGISQLLAFLKDKGLKTACLSNKPHFFTEKICITLFENSINLVLGQTERFPKKPDPTAINYILNTLKVNNSEVVFVGDSGVDIITAKNADIFSIGIKWGFRSEKELIENGADLIVSHPSQIIDFLKQNI